MVKSSRENIRRRKSLESPKLVRAEKYKEEIIKFSFELDNEIDSIVGNSGEALKVYFSRENSSF